MDIVRKPWTPLISDRFVMRNVSRFATPASIVIVAVLVELWHRVTPDKPRMQIEISSWERWMMRPVINGPRDIPPVGFLYSGAFHARHLLDLSPLSFPFFSFPAPYPRVEDIKARTTIGGIFRFVYFPQRIPFPSWWIFICFIKYLEIWLILSTLEIGSRVLALESFKGKLQRRETCHALRTVGNILKVKMAKWCTRGAADSTRRSVPQAEKKERKKWGWRKKSGRSHRLRQSRVYRLQCRWVA